MQVSKLRVTEIFYSLQGESALMGFPTVFIRLTGCPLRCNYCDTAYAFQGGTLMAIADILQQVEKFTPKYVCVTGGEPLAQSHCLQLLTQLCDQGYTVSLETSGALDISVVDPRVIKIIDIKTPGSGESQRNLWQNLNFLSSQDQIKFVICDHNDYLWSKEIMKIMHQYHPAQGCQILFSPSYHQLQPQHLADWILQDRLPVRMQLQLHKFIWGDVPGK